MLFCSYYYPIHIAQSICFCTFIPIWIRIILFITDFLNIFDIIISFFRAYYNFEYVLIKKNEKIVTHYLKKILFLILLQLYQSLVFHIIFVLKLNQMEIYALIMMLISNIIF